jgi:hypothetical protein
MRAVRRVFVVGALTALVVAVFPSASAQTPTVTSVIGSAQGLAVGLTIEPDVGSDTLDFGPTPTVTLPPGGGSVSDSVSNVSESVLGVALTATTLSTSAEGQLGPAGFATAESVVEDLALGIVGGESIVGAEAISATCDADLSGVTGSTTLVGASVLTETLEAEPPPNTQLTISITNGITAEIGVTLNGQVQNPDGSLSVTAIALEIDVQAGPLSITGTLAIGPATCGVVEGVELPAEVIAPPPPVQAQVRFTG